MYFLMKAQSLNLKKLKPGLLWSIKYDGMRAFWDGGMTRGAYDVPWCKGKRATGLWSINANIIYAPEWFLNDLPEGICLDGELWAGIGGQYKVTSICKRHIPDERWREVTYNEIQSIAPSFIYYPRIINQPNCNMVISTKTVAYMQEKASKLDMSWNEPQLYIGNKIEQHKFQSLESIPFNDLVEEGHEGIVLFDPEIPWTPIRSWRLMKYKPFKESEAIVIGYTGGRKGFESKIGALIVRWGTKVFEIGSGLTLPDRESNDPDACMKYKGIAVPNGVHSLTILPNTLITFKYRELTPNGIPKEPRYYRVREDE